MFLKGANRPISAVVFGRPYIKFPWCHLAARVETGEFQATNISQCLGEIVSFPSLVRPFINYLR